MAFQELATNASRYGALSGRAGRVEVRWTAAGEPRSLLYLSWTESGGPPVSAPARRGFGSRLIERGLADAVDGKVSLDFARAGLTCTVLARPPGRTVA